MTFMNVNSIRIMNNIVMSINITNNIETYSERKLFVDRT